MSDTDTAAIMTPAEYATAVGPRPERRARALTSIRESWAGQLRRAQLLGLADQWLALDTLRSMDTTPAMYLQVLREYGAAGWRTREVDYALYLPAAK